jgi:hypothetical protein
MFEQYRVTPDVCGRYKVAIDFCNKWFDEKCRGIWDACLLPAVKPPIGAYLEIGLGEGHSMRWVMENLKPQKAIAIDPYAPKRRHEKKQYEKQQANMRENLAEWIESGQLDIYEEKSIDVLRRIDWDNQFDLVYVDGSHKALDCCTDCCLAWPMLKMQGILIMDDYDRRWHIGWPWSKEGYDSFMTVADKRFRVLWGNPLDFETTNIGIRKFRDH